ncbi:hypothetical protein SLITO_v1c08610 [Spiroplasma litorale]|uniref:Uncharacterized protein n=1 Tax=Spiroplasma litorale TaxID=216942 RepID=A0A0K1W2S0_9MOLU|nr:hypothetical protein [Spiroplasma litorale]AKX34476.1 hypothetical protein SLITO_v1c08610 [Spiroplasma litorale]
MKKIEYNFKQEKEDNINSYYGFIEIYYGEKFYFKYFDYTKGEIFNKIEPLNYSHKGSKLGWAFQKAFEKNTTIILQNINYTKYEFFQEDILLSSFFYNEFKIVI